MLYKKETPFDQLSYETLMFLYECTKTHLDYSCFGHSVINEIKASIKFKCDAIGHSLPEGVE